MKIRFLLPMGAFVVLIGLLWAGLRLNSDTIPSPLIGKPAPAFTANRLWQEQTISPQAMRRQVWILNVWASWCAACRDEHPLLNRIAARNIVPIMGLNYKDPPDDAKNWLLQLGDPYDAVAVDRSGDIGVSYGVYGVPETFVIDKRGVIRLKHIGPLSADMIERQLLPLLARLQRETG